MLSVSTRFGSMLLLALTMLLAFSLAVPPTAAAADDLWSGTKPVPAQTKYNWMFDYYKPMTQGTPAGPSSRVIHPVDIGLRPASWYLHNYLTGGTAYKTAPTEPAPRKPGNPVLTGKIIEPGKTLVRIPEVTKNKAPWLEKVKGGVKGSGGMLGLATVGMGGVAEIPADAENLYRLQGVPETCIADAHSCTETDFKKMMDVNGCGLIYGKCKQLGSGSNEPVIPIVAMLQDLWRSLTGQSSENEPSVNADPVTNPRGCWWVPKYQELAGTQGKVSATVEIVKPKPSGTTAGQRWQQSCGALVGTTFVPPANVQTTCILNDRSATVDGVPYGKESTMSLLADSTGTFTQPLCTNPSAQLISIKLYEVQTQAQHDANTNSYAAMKPVEYYVQTPTSHVEDTKIETSVNCVGPAGQPYTYTTSVSAIDGAIEPQCPKGSSLVDYTIRDKSPGNPVSGGISAGVIASEAVDPAAREKYGDIAGNGAPLQVYLDGKPCMVGDAGCEGWPAIAAKTPSRVSCNWGGHTVALENCYVLSNAYKTESGVIFDQVSGTWVAIDNYGKPVAANPEPWNPVNPAPVPGATPGTGTGSTPGTSTPGLPSTGTMPQAGEHCGASWDFNPWDWVGNQLYCAFVPKTDLTTRIDTLAAKLDGDMPFSWLNPQALAGPESGACPNWRVSVGNFSDNVVCGKDFTNALIGARQPIFILVSTAMVWPLIRSIWYASIPFLKVQASK